jgi:hypothetical protein
MQPLSAGSTAHISLNLGVTGDPIGRLIKRTALNPAVTLLFILAARYTKKGSDLSILHETAFSRIKYLFAFGLLRLVSNYLDNGFLNNWKSDKYDWKKEIVLITGGAGGIGGQVVRLLAERGIKVVVLDVIPMTFTARITPCVLLSASLLTKLQPNMSTITSATSHLPLPSLL